jgi:homocysteine S-methyltransferase
VLKVTEAIAAQRTRPVFVCDFSPPRGGTGEFVEDARGLDADFICVAYNPGKAVRVDSAAAAFEIKRSGGREAIFNLSPRDMNKLALQTRLLGAQLLELNNVLVVQGDPIADRDATSAVNDFTSTGLIAAIRGMNEGLDYKGLKLRAPSDFCIGASIDLTRELEQEASLTHRKLEAGAQFFVTQPVFDVQRIEQFRDAYSRKAGSALDVPVCWGLQVLVADGVLFSSVPESVREQLAGGRDGVEIALEGYEALQGIGVEGVYLVSPIMRGGARDYAAGQRFLSQVT